MTDGPDEDPGEIPAAGGGETRQRRSLGRWLGSLNKDDRFTSTVGVSQIVGGVAAVVAVVLTVWTRGGPKNDSAREPVATATPAPAPAPTSPRPSVPSTPSSEPTHETCWTSALVTVDCRETHRYEAIGATVATTQCGLPNVIAYLGGLTRLDVTIARPRILGKMCSVDAARDVSGSAKGVLLSTSPAWRKCLDSRTNRVVPCSVTHTGEFVATGNRRRATLAECVSAATQYLDQDLSEIGQDLRVLALDVRTNDPAPERCIIEARGSHTLTGSVRNLGVSPVPLT